MANPNRQPPQQHVLTVVSTEQIGPHLVRVVLTGESLARFGENAPRRFTDAYVKLAYVDPASGIEPPFDVRELRATLPPEQLPRVRTYTVRRVDRDARELVLDFVTHGDEGIAAPWAMAAQPGDRLILSGPGGAYAPDPAASHHVLAGDLSALPAIAASLEAMEPGMRGVALLEIADPADEMELEHPEGVEVRWLLNPDHATGFLAEAVAALEWPEGVQVFVHGERESIKAVRGVLRDRGVARELLSISAYWAQGRTEDRFQAEKREPIGKID